jgi:hypothetical protein
VKLLFDENLSRRLVVRLAELYPDSAHVVEFDLLESPDREIWEFAKASNFVIVTTDSDFTNSQQQSGHLPKSFGSGAGRTRRGTPNAYCAATPFGSRSSRPIRNSASWFWITTDALGPLRAEVQPTFQEFK